MASLVGGSCQPGRRLLTMLYLRGVSIKRGDIGAVCGLFQHPHAGSSRLVCVQHCLGTAAEQVWVTQHHTLPPTADNSQAEDGDLNLQRFDQPVVVVIHLFKHLQRISYEFGQMIVTSSRTLLCSSNKSSRLMSATCCVFLPSLTCDEECSQWQTGESQMPTTTAADHSGTHETALCAGDCWCTLT